MDLPNLHDFNGTDFQQTVQLQVPSMNLAPTYTYTGKSYGLPLGIDFRYELKLDVNVRGLFVNFKVQVPVIVGTDSMINQQETLVNNSIEMATPSAPVFDHDELPPAYESVIENVKQ